MNNHLMVDIHDCARCGGDHDQLVFIGFTAPITDSDGTIWNYWSLCPLLGEPVLLRVATQANPEIVVAPDWLEGGNQRA